MTFTKRLHPTAIIQSSLFSQIILPLWHFYSVQSTSTHCILITYSCSSAGSGDLGGRRQGRGAAMWRHATHTKGHRQHALLVQGLDRDTPLQVGGKRSNN